MKIWTTQTGQKIYVKDMSTEHIQNCINGLENGTIEFYTYDGKDEETENEWLKTFEKEINLRKIKQEKDLSKKIDLLIDYLRDKAD